MTSNISWVVFPDVGATYVADSVPPGPMATVTPLARSSETGEVESRAGWVVRRYRAQVHVAERSLGGHGHVAGDGRGAGRHPAGSGNAKRPGAVRGERTGQLRAGARIEDPRRREGNEPGAGRIGREVAGHIEDDVRELPGRGSDICDRERARRCREPPSRCWLDHRRMGSSGVELVGLSVASGPMNR